MSSARGADFVHLHCHSEYSLLDGAARIGKLVQKASDLGMPALAITDHGAMYGAIEFYRAAKNAGIKPIIGCEVYVSPTTRFDRSPKASGEDNYHHLVLLAKSNKGYENLMKITTLGFFDGYYYKPRVDDEVLAEHSEGLIALSGCIAGRIPKLIKASRYEDAKAAAEAYREVFGNGNFYLEVQNHGLADQKAVNEALLRISRETGIPAVLTNDLHYVDKADAKTHDVLLCIQTGSTLAEPNRLRFETEEFYLKTAEEMASLFPDEPHLLGNTLKIAEMCDVEIEFGQIFLPKYEAPEGQTLDSYFERLCRQGAKKRYGQELPPEVEDRLNYEIEMIKRMGFSGYFLVVQDFVNWAKDRGIKVGPGRGSAAGSLVAYALNITNIDPLRHDLLFERFLNPSRITMPDIDIDFCFERRGEVVDYVTKKYGEDKVAQIITFGTMAARAAIRDAGRVFDVPYGVVDKIAKLVPEGLYGGHPWTIEAALEFSQELKERYENDEVARQIIDAAKGLDGLARQDSIHAAGVVISDEELTKYTPLQRKGGAEVVTQYEMKAIQEIGLLKMDFLGLRTLTVIDDACKIIKRTRGIDLDIDAVPLDDENTYRMLQEGNSVGVFQLESTGMRALMREIKPASIEDLIDLIALYRPGPIGSGMLRDYVDRKHGRKPIEYPDPSLEPILEGTYGVIIYQEQVMRIASEMAGFSMADADILRWAMSKKKAKVLAELKEKFISGAVSRGNSAAAAEKVFELIHYFSGYGFNKSHSAAYAYVSYQTAYLKANYPVEFMAALLTSVKGNKDKVARYVNECRRMGIEVLPPDVNESYADFTVVGDSIRFGLSAVRNVGEGAIEAIIEERTRVGRFKSIFDFCRRVDLSLLNKRLIESLIKGGAFDSLGATRRALSLIYESAVDYGIRKQKDAAAGVLSLFGDPDNGGVEPDPDVDNVEEWQRMELLAFEKEMLGLYVTDHPLLEVEEMLKEKTEYSMAELVEQKDGTSAWVGGIVSRVTRVTTKRGEPMARIQLEDLEGSVEVIVFPKVYEQFRDLVAEDKLICVRGRLDRKEDESKLLAEELVALSEARGPGPKAKKLYITIDSSRFDRDTLEELKAILSNHPGDIPVTLRVRDRGRLITLALGSEHKVGIGNGVFAELKALLGEAGVELA